jgi:hypothetical protein
LLALENNNFFGTMALEVDTMTLLVLMASTTYGIMGIPMGFKL